MNTHESADGIADRADPSRLQAPSCTLGIDEVHIWLAQLDHPSWSVADLSGSLSADEHRRAGTYVFECHQRRFIIARGLLRWLLAGYVDVEPGSLRLRYGDWGKPELATPSGNPPLRFNYSHSHRLALYALARGRRIGVDLEMLRPVPEAESIANGWFSPNEQSALLAADPHHRAALFLRYWTAREAYAKAVGHGLRDALKGIEIPLVTQGARHSEERGAAVAAGWSLRELHFANDYVGALVVEGNRYRLTSGLLTPAALARPLVSGGNRRG